jgi:hypothetical protein
LTAHGNGKYTLKETYLGAIQPYSSVTIGFRANKDVNVVPVIDVGKLTKVVFDESVLVISDPVEFEPKLFSNATVEHDFNGSSVLVMLDKNIQGINKIHEPSFFGDFPITEIIDITWHETEEEIEFSQNNPETFRQMLKIILPTNCKENVLEIIKKLEKVNGILCAEPNFYVQNNSTSSESYDESDDSGEFDETTESDLFWYLDLISAPAAWDNFTRGSRDVLVGVIETGIGVHPAVEGNINRGLGRSFIYDFDEEAVGEHLPTEGFNNRHGTLVAGVISSVADVTLVPLTYDSTIWSSIAAIGYAGRNNIHILNFSQGFPESFVSDEIVSIEEIHTLREAIRRYPGLFVAAAGNSGEDNDGSNPNHPSSYNLPNIISVGASNENDERSIGWPAGGSSSFGARTVHLFAPGTGILTTCGWRIPPCDCDFHTWPYICIQKTSCHESLPCNLCGNCYSDGECHSPHDYCRVNGTSFATPMVAGVAALIKSEFPNATTAQIRWAILNGVDRIDELENLCTTGGRLNAHAALEAAQILFPVVLCTLRSVCQGQLSKIVVLHRV